MPLPESGEISIRDINVEIDSTKPDLVRDLDSAAIIFNIPTKPHGMDEFYGLELSDLSVDPTSWTFVEFAASKDFNVISRAGLYTATDDRTWISIPVSNFTQTKFRVDVTEQLIGNFARAGNVTVTNPTTSISIPITQNGRLATVSITDSSINITNTGVGQTVSVTSNSTWQFSSIASWITINPSSGTAGTTSVTFSGVDNSTSGNPLRSDTVVLSATAAGGNNQTVNVSVVQAAGPALEIDIDPNILEVGGTFTAANFFVSTNASNGYTVTEIPEWATDFIIGALGPTITFPQNNEPGAVDRSGNVTVQTVSSTPGVTEVTDTATLTQLAALPEAINVEPRNDDFTIDASGESNKYFDVTTTSGYTTTWLPFKEAIFGGTDTWVTIVDTAEQTNAGSFRVTFASNPIGGSSRTIRIGARKVGGTLEGVSVITQDAGPAPTLILTPTDNVSVDINGNGSFTLESNTNWFIDNSSFASWIEPGDISPATGTAGTYTITINASPRAIGTTSTRSDDITISTDSPGGTNLSRTNYTLVQAANPATISVTPGGPLSVSGFGQVITFSVSTNTSYSVSDNASWITIDNITAFSFRATFFENTTGASRSGTITAVTTSAGTNVSDSVSITQPVKPPENLSLTPDNITVPSTGQSFIAMNVTVDPNYPTLWSISEVPFTGVPAPNITFSGTTSGTTNGTFTISVSATSVTETLRTRVRVTNSSTGKIDDTIVEQNAALPTYYIFAPCSGGSNVMTTAVVPSSSQRAFDSNSNFYSYTNTTTTNASLHTIRSLTLQAATGCPPVYISWLAERNSDGFVSRLGPYPSGYSINQEVYANDQCWTILGESESSAVYTITGDCPTAPPPPPPSTCFLVGVVRNRNASLACCDGISDSVYFNASSVEGATIYYGSDSTCSTPFPFSQYFSVGGNQYYQWVSGVMSGPFTCPTCL